MSFLSYEDLVARGITLARTTISKKASRGTFPRPIRGFGGRLVWKEAEVDRWIARQRGGFGERNTEDRTGEVERAPTHCLNCGVALRYVDSKAMTCSGACWRAVNLKQSLPIRCAGSGRAA